MNQAAIAPRLLVCMAAASLCSMPLEATAPLVTSSALTAAEMREDLRYLRDRWLPLDKSFNEAQRSEFLEIINGDIERAEKLSYADFVLDISRAVALSRNGHTGAYDPSGKFHELPIQVYWFAEGLYIVRTSPDLKDLLGARIEKVGKLSSHEALTRVTPYISGTRQHVKALSPYYLRMPEVLQQIGASKDVSSVELTLRLQNGSVRKIAIRPAAPDPASTTVTLMPEPRDTKGRWPQVIDGLREIPLTYRSPVDASIAFIGDHGNVAYVRSNSVFGLDDKLDPHYSIIPKFIQIMGEVAKRRTKDVIVDLRYNGGGDFFNTELFSEGISRILPPDGRLFILVGRDTFSAAIVTGALLKGHGGVKAVLVGETMGDNGRFWSEGGDLALPNSKILVHYSNGLQDWIHGCSDLDHCHWPVVAFGVADGSIEPQIRIEPTFADYVAGRDAAIEKVLLLTRNSNSLPMRTN